MPNTTRDDDRVRMLTIPAGWPARTVAALLTAAADETQAAAEELDGSPCDHPTGTYDRRRKSREATAVVEARSDGIAVYAPRALKEARP